MCGTLIFSHVFLFFNEDTPRGFKTNTPMLFIMPVGLQGVMGRTRREMLLCNAFNAC